MTRPFPPSEALPNRRQGMREDFEWPRLPGVKPQRLALLIGIDPLSGRPAEVFLSGMKSGSDQDARADNAMIAMSKLLQAGFDPAELAATFTAATLEGAVALRVAHRMGLAQDPTAPNLPARSIDPLAVLDAEITKILLEEMA